MERNPTATRKLPSNSISMSTGGQLNPLIVCYRLSTVVLYRMGIYRIQQNCHDALPPPGVPCASLGVWFFLGFHLSTVQNPYTTLQKSWRSESSWIIQERESNSTSQDFSWNDRGFFHPATMSSSLDAGVWIHGTTIPGRAPAGIAIELGHPWDMIGI